MSISNIPKLIFLVIAFFSLQFSAISTDNLTSANANSIGLANITAIKVIIDTTNDILSKSIQFVFEIVIIFLLYRLWVWIRKDDGILVYPFEVANNEDKYNGKAISTMLVAELRRIEQVIKSEQNIFVSDGFLEDRNTFPPISISDEKTTIPQLGTVGVGAGSVSIGELMAIIKFFYHGSGKKITGSLEKSGSDIKLIACLSGNQAGYWEVPTKSDTKAKVETVIVDGVDDQAENNKDNSNNNLISELVRDLSYEITYHISREHIFARTISGFKYYVEAMDAYQKYYKTKEARYLQLSTDRCLDANRFEPDSYKITYLFYYLGIAHYYEHNYKKSEKMLCKAIKSSPYYAFAWNALALALMNQSQDKYYKAQTASEKAIDLLPDYAGYLQKNGIEFPLQDSKEYNQSLAYFKMTKGLAQFKQSKLPEALNDYEEAIRLDPGLAYAWYLKSEALKELKGKKKEAEDAYNEAINLNPSLAWSSKSEAYIDLPCEEDDAR